MQRTTIDESGECVPTKRDSGEFDLLFILCPRCHDLVEASYDGAELSIDAPCSCVNDEHLSESEWSELIYRLWGDFSILKIPDGVDVVESNN